jgi:serine/threonine-protein kinase
MAEEIMSALVRVPGIRVASRTSAFRAGQERRGLADVARALCVGHVLEGSVRSAGSHLRVAAQLTDAQTGYQLWAERYDREAADVFALQDEIAAGVVEAVRARLAPDAAAIEARPRVASVEAYQHYLKGRHLRYTRNDHGSAVREFREAVRLDPGHAPSWIGLAEANVLATFYALAPIEDARSAAREALATAARLGSESADSFSVAGLLAFSEQRWAAAEQSLRRAVELRPDLVQARCWLAQVLAAQNRAAEAAAHSDKARASDPLAPYPYAMSGVAMLRDDRRREAIAFFEQALAFEPGNTLALWGLGTALVAEGRHEEGISAFERALTAGHRGGFIHGGLGWALAEAGRTAEALAVLDELRARPEKASTVVSEAWLLAALGRTDEAFGVLERAQGERQPVLGLIGLQGFDRLRPDPRFAALLERLGLPDPRRGGAAAER